MQDRLLVQLDVGPAGAVLRVALGATFALGARRWMPGAGPGAAATALLGVLFLVKVAAVVGRRLVRPGPWARATWEWRRQLARAHDAYQLRKLLWIGAGILSVQVLAGPALAGQAALGAACVVVGALAEVRWRGKGLAVTPGRPT